jgi:YggT family protein
MNSFAILNFVDLFAFVANGLIVIHILASWFAGLRRIPGFEAAIGMAELILLPVRKVIPPRGLLDWSPLVTIIGLQLAQSMLHNLLK